MLFVCTHGTAKSLLAKLFFERASAPSWNMLRALSRAIDPDEAVPDWMRSALSREGFEIGTWRPSPLSRADIDAAERVITFDVAPQESLVAYLRIAGGGRAALSCRHEAWDGLPALSENYAAGRKEIATRVEALAEELGAATPLTRAP